MFKALGALAVCMTGGALLLAWLEPAPEDYAAGGVALGDRADARLLRSLARRAVRTTSSPPGKPWDGVELVAVTEGASSSAAALAATAPPGDLHFLIARSGRFRSLPSWRRQQAVSQQGRVIRIGLMGAPSSARVSTAQWTALRALLAELADQAGPIPGDLPIRLAGAEKKLDSSPFVRHLRHLLTREGLLG